MAEQGFIKLIRSEEAEFLQSYPFANHLLQVMAYRARRSEHSINGLKPGQCFLGDISKIGLTQGQYRAAKKQLARWNLATFTTTNKGTIGTIANTAIYDINTEVNDKQTTSKQQADDMQATTNKECKKGRMEELKEHRKDSDGSNSKPNNKKLNFNEKDLECAKWFFSRVQIIVPKAKKPNFETWANVIRKIRELDNRDPRDICALFDWCNKHEFWHKNILSPEKLRAKWDTLTAQRGNNGPINGNNSNRPTGSMGNAQAKVESALEEQRRKWDESAGILEGNDFDVFRSVDLEERSGSIIELDRGDWSAE